MLSWFRKRRDDTPLDDGSIRQTLEANVWQYRHLDAAGRKRVAEVVAVLARDKEWVGGSGFRVTGEMRVTISGVAALVTLGLDEPFFFPRLKTVILYPGGYNASPKGDVGLLGGDSDEPWQGGGRLGEAWQGGPIVLSWRHALRNARAPGGGHSVVLHELAHHLDGLDGHMDGVPVMPDRGSQREWHAVTDGEYHRLLGQSRRDEATLLDTYGASNRAEFFAVAVECFFERPHELRERHADLYRLLTGYFHQSPADWLPEPAPSETPTAQPLRHRRRRASAEAATGDYESLGMSEHDQRFSRGVELLDRGLAEEAIVELTALLEATPDDAEALAHRAAGRLQLGDDRGALADAEASLAIEPDEVDALLAAADAGIALGADQESLRHVRRALGLDNRSGYAYLLLGMLQHRAGEPRKAKRALKKATGFEPYDAESHYWLGCVCESLGEERAAQRAFARAEQLDPDTDFEAA